MFFLYDNTSIEPLFISETHTRPEREEKIKPPFPGGVRPL